MSFDPVFEAVNDFLYESAVSQIPADGAATAKYNARKHGVTAELEPQSVRHWYRIIVNDTVAELPVLDVLNDMQVRALKLAQAEVSLRRVYEVLADFEKKRDPLFEELANLFHDYKMYLTLSFNSNFDSNTRYGFRIMSRAIKKDIRTVQKQINKRTRLLQRYKREALSKQSKAQKVWCDQFKRD